MSTKAFCPCGGESNLISGTGTENQIFILITPAAINFFHQILKNCHFGVRKKSFLTHMDLYDPRSTNKIQFFDEISTSGKKLSFMKYLKYSTKAFFPCGGGSNLILGTGMKSQIFILRTPAAVKFFYGIVKK